MNGIIRQRIKDSIYVKQLLLKDEKILGMIEQIAHVISESIASGGTVFLCGNGGSASDALHIAGEIVGRFEKERKGWSAVALNADVATITAISNDYGYEEIFARQVEGYMHKEDVIIGISTSGNSENVYRALLRAKGIGATTIGLLGKDGGKIKNEVEFPILVPCNVTARIQESHIMIGHIICELIENELITGYR